MNDVTVSMKDHLESGAQIIMKNQSIRTAKARKPAAARLIRFCQRPDERSGFPELEYPSD
jgi:hypothetical protein